MKVDFRNYTDKAGITDDYHKVREFLVRLGYAEYTYARWDWMITHDYLDQSSLDKIGIWEVQGNVVGLATYDCRLGNTFCLALEEYRELKREILFYAKENLRGEEGFNVVISDSDTHFQNIAMEMGFVATREKECDAIFLCDEGSTDYFLPLGFTMVSLDEDFDMFKYKNVLWKGFDHEKEGEGELVFTEKEKEQALNSMKRENVDLNLKLAVKDSQGNFVAYCGMWYDHKSDFGVIEPVATVPAFRRMGLGKAVVLEGIKRVKELGASFITVGSSQQFYYSIGMRPHSTNSVWRFRG